MKIFWRSLKIFIIISVIFFKNLLVNGSFDWSDVDPWSAWATSIINSWGSSGFTIIDTIFKKITEHLFSVIALILIGVFIYIGYLFLTSEWDEAQFKKAWKSFVYVIIWIVIIVLSWWVVKLVTTVGI